MNPLTQQEIRHPKDSIRSWLMILVLACAGTTGCTKTVIIQPPQPPTVNGPGSPTNTVPASPTATVTSPTATVTTPTLSTPLPTSPTSTAVVPGATNVIIRPVVIVKPNKGQVFPSPSGNTVIIIKKKP